jgi:hypothetical protein
MLVADQRTVSSNVTGYFRSLRYQAVSKRAQSSEIQSVLSHIEQFEFHKIPLQLWLGGHDWARNEARLAGSPRDDNSLSSIATNAVFLRPRNGVAGLET